MKFKYEGMKIHSISFYTRSAAHIHRRRFDNSPVECAQVIFHKTLEDGSIKAETNHLVRVNAKHWKVGDTGPLEIFILIDNRTNEYLETEVIFPPLPEPPKKKKRRRRRRKNRKPQHQAA